MPRYLVPIQGTVSTTIPVEAGSPEEAAEIVWDSDGYQDAHLGLCHQCAGHMNPPDEWQLVTNLNGTPSAWLDPT